MHDSWKNWLARGYRLVVIVCWALYLWLLTHESVSPAFFGRYSPEYMLFLCLVLLAVLLLTCPVFFRIPRPAFIGAMNIVGKLGLFIASLAFTLLAAEFLLRATDLLGISLFEEVNRYVLELEADSELTYRHRANLDTVYQGVEFRTNALGLRDDPIAPRSPGDLRILVLGDSVTLGWGVPLEQTYSEQLEQLLGEASGIPVEVINSGVSGYNTVQELAFLRRHIETLAPDLVLLMYVENDIEATAVDMTDMRQRWENPPNANATLLRWSWLYRLFYYIGPDLVGSPEAPDRVPAFDHSMNALAEIHRLAGQHETEFAAYLFRMLPDAATDALHAEISNLADRHEFRYVDTLPWFSGESFRSLVNSFVDTHPNAQGHRIIAEGIARDLRKSGMLCRSLGNDDNSLCADKSS